MPEKDADDWDECPESVRIEKDMNAQYNALNKKKKKNYKKELQHQGFPDGHPLQY